MSITITEDFVMAVVGGPTENTPKPISNNRVRGGFDSFLISGGRRAYLISRSAGLTPGLNFPKPNQSGLYSPTYSTLARAGIFSCKPTAQ